MGGADVALAALSVAGFTFLVANSVPVNPLLFGLVDVPGFGAGSFALLGAPGAFFIFFALFLVGIRCFW